MNPIYLKPPTSSQVGSSTYTNIPLNIGYDVSCNGDVGCPRRLYNESCNIPSCGCKNAPMLASCQSPTEVIYNINQNVNYCDSSNYPASSYDNSQGYFATTVEIPGTGYNIYSGNGIYLDQLENGVRINNGGLVSANVQGEAGSGIIVTNQNTRSDPNFIISVSPADLIAKANLATTLVFNGQTYSAFNGVITINSGLAGGAITNINSPKGTVIITPASVGAVNIDIKPVKINGSNLGYDTDGAVLNLVSGLNTTVSSTGVNSVKINVANNAFVKTVNSQSPDGNGNVNINPTSIFKQATKVLDAGNITSLTTSGFDLVATIPTLGSTSSSIAATDGLMLFQNGSLLTLDKYTRTGSIITTSGVSWTVGNILTWVVIKST